MRNTANYKNFNIFNYFTTWCNIWFILYKLKIVNNNPLFAYVSMIIPTLYMLIKYIKLKYTEDKFYKFIIIISTSIIMHYIPLIYLLYHNHNYFNIQILFISLILLNIYLCFIYYQDL